MTLIFGRKLPFALGSMGPLALSGAAQAQQLSLTDIIPDQSIANSGIMMWPQHELS